MPIPPIRVVIAGVDQLSGVLNRSNTKLAKFGQSATNIGRRMSMGLTLPIVGLGIAAVTASTQFETSMNKVAALTQEGTEGMTQMREAAKKLGIETQFSASQAADAMAFLGMAGWETNEILQGTPHLLNLAAASQTELAQTADIASNIMGAFQISAKDTGHVTDVLAATTASANVNLEMLAESMKDAAPIAHAAGISLEDTAATIGFLGNVGIQGSKSGTALKNMLIRLAAPGGKAASVLRHFGISVADAQGNLRPYTQILGELSGKMVDLGSQDKLAVLEALFGKRVIAGAAALTSDMAGVNSGFRQLANSLTDVNGRAQQMAETMMEGAPGAFKRFASAWEGAMIAIGEAGLVDAITGMVEKAVELLRWVADLNPELLKWMTIILALVAAIGPMLIVVGQMAIAINALIPVVMGLGGAMAFLAANPIILIIAAIIALIAVFVLFWDEWKAIGTAWVAGVKIMIDAVMGFFNDMWTGLKEGVKVMADVLVGFFEKMWVGIKKFIDNAIKFLLKLLKVILMVMFPLPFLAAKLGAKFLPANIRSKISFLTGDTGESATPKDILQQQGQASEFQGLMRFENVPPGARVEVEKGELDIETDTGLLPAGA